MPESVRLLPADRREWLVPLGFMLSIILIITVGIAIDRISNDRPMLLQVVYRPVLFPGMFTIAPFALAAANVYKGGSLTGGISIGVAPGLAFLITAWGAELIGVGSSGDAPAWVLAVAFATVGLGCALVGTGTGVIIQKVRAWV